MIPISIISDIHSVNVKSKAISCQVWVLIPLWVYRRCEQEESVEKLPDALLLLESPTLAQVTRGDHASVVAAAMAESALRKRDLNGNTSSLPRRPKLPRGNLPHSKNITETLGNVLVPPQLKGRLVSPSRYNIGLFHLHFHFVSQSYGETIFTC